MISYIWKYGIDGAQKEADKEIERLENKKYILENWK